MSKKVNFTESMFQDGVRFGAINGKQSKLLGLNWNKDVSTGGWKKKILNKPISREQYMEFVKLKGATKKDPTPISMSDVMEIVDKYFPSDVVASKREFIRLDPEIIFDDCQQQMSLLTKDFRDGVIKTLEALVDSGKGEYVFPVGSVCYYSNEDTAYKIVYRSLVLHGNGYRVHADIEYKSGSLRSIERPFDEMSLEMIYHLVTLILN